MNQERVIKEVQAKLFELQDIKYRDFHAKLMPTVNKEKIIGVRIPVHSPPCFLTFFQRLNKNFALYSRSRTVWNSSI